VHPSKSLGEKVVKSNCGGCEMAAILLMLQHFMAGCHI